MTPTLITSLLFFLPILIFNPPLFLSTIIQITILTSLLFWSNPIKHSYIHEIDAFFTRLTIISFIIYKLFINKTNNILFITNSGVMFIFFYMSNFYSKIEWCCYTHIFFHLCAHILGLISISIALTKFKIIN